MSTHYFDIIVSGSKYRIILVYRPPSTSIDQTKLFIAIKSLVDLLYNLSHPKATTVILGDLNLPSIDWQSCTARNDGVSNLFLEFCLNTGLNQFVLEPTRIANSGASNILDIILSNDQFAINVLSINTPLSTSVVDFLMHFPQTTSYQDTCEGTGITDSHSSTHDFTDAQSDFEPHIKLPTYDWANGNYDAINEFLISFDWHQLFGFSFDVDSIWTNFKQILWPLIASYIPQKLVSHNLKYRPRQYPKFIHNLLSRKAAIWSKLKVNKSSNLWSSYRKVAHDCKQAVLNFDIARENKILDANNTGAFFRFVNKKMANPSGIANLLDSSGNLLTSDKDKTDLLNEYFCSVFTTDDNLLPDFPSRLPESAAGLNDISFTTKTISKITRKLKINSAAGPDGLPPIFYHRTEISIIHPLSILYSSIIDLHTLLNEWKYAIIAPIFKKGCSSDPANYRSIALTCTCCKILECIVASEIICFLNSHNLITKQQHGFLQKHSTVTNLLESVNDWTFSLSNRKSVVIAYIDFKRAFDAVSHSKLIHKLAAYGIHGNLLFWIASFLSNRKQYVQVGSSLSSLSLVTNGVPQGSVIGPLLFSLFINDITDNLDSSTTSKIFADDIKLYTEFSTTISPQHLQTHLDLINQWSITCQLLNSHSKCNILVLGRRALNQLFSISDVTVPTVDFNLDLGVTVDSDLKFTTHITNIVKKAKQRSALIHRVLPFS